MNYITIICISELVSEKMAQIIMFIAIMGFLMYVVCVYKAIRTMFTTHRKLGEGIIGGWEYSCCNNPFLSKYNIYLRKT